MSIGVRKSIVVSLAAIVAAGVLLAQYEPLPPTRLKNGLLYMGDVPYSVLRAGEDDSMPWPADGDDPSEWVFGRLRYKNHPPRLNRGDWSTDYPKADRHFIQGLRRLTLINARSTEQVVGPDTDDVFDYPWLYAVEVGGMGFSPDEARRMRQYLLRGGFLLVDDFHGDLQWAGFAEAMAEIFPDRPIVDLKDSDQIFHTVFELDQRFQVPGLAAMMYGRTYEDYGGDTQPRWRGILDDKGRVMVAICFNMDLGDGWEHADAPWYPEKYTSHAYRIAINYIVYAMTH